MQVIVQLPRWACTVLASSQVHRARATDSPHKWHLLAQTVLAILCNSKLMLVDLHSSMTTEELWCSQHALVMG